MAWMQNETTVYHIQKKQHGTRLDRFLISATNDMSRTHLQRLIRDGNVTINDKVVKQPSYALRDGDEVNLTLPPPRPLDTIVPENIALDILHEDSHLIVLNKPAGMLVHPANGVYTGTLVNALLAHCTDLSGIGGIERPGIVHRLDKDTSGILVVAKTDSVHRNSLRNLRSIALRVNISLLCVASPRKPRERLMPKSQGVGVIDGE